MNKFRYSHIIWDWNGTLLDDVGIALASVNAMLARRGEKLITMAQYYDYIGIPIRKFYERVFDLNTVDYNEILKEYNQGYEERLRVAGLSTGAEEVLEQLSAAGIRQTVVSSCEQNQLKRYIRHFGIASYFDAVLGSEDFLAGSKVERARSFLQSRSISPSEVLVVGDLEHDWEMAKAIGADCVLVSTGHQSTETLKKCAVPVFSSVRDIVSEICL